MCKVKNDLWTQIGVMAFVFRGRDIRNCTNSVFTKVNHYMDFINKGVYMQLFVLIQFLLKETYLVEIYHLAEIISNILFW